MGRPGQPVGTPPTRFDYIGRWLVDHHQLGVMERSQVTQAVFVKPRSLGDPRLRQAACGLAAEVLNHRLRLPRMQRYVGRILAAMGLVLVVFGLVLQLVSHRGGAQIVIGVVVIVAGAVANVWAPRQMRNNVELALALNKDGAH
jgi:uncharacterized membrane protein